MYEVHTQNLISTIINKNGSCINLTKLAKVCLKYWTRLRSTLNLNVFFVLLEGKAFEAVEMIFLFVIVPGGDFIQLEQSAPKTFFHKINREPVWEWFEVSPFSSIGASLQVVWSNYSIVALTYGLLLPKHGFLSINLLERIVTLWELCSVPNTNRRALNFNGFQLLLL